MYKTNIILLLILAVSVSTVKSDIRTLASGDVKAEVALANDGDIIELTTSGGAYTWSAMYDVTVDKAITIRAAAGLTARPVITYAGTTGVTKYFFGYKPTAGTKSVTWTLEGVVLDGDSKPGSLFQVKCIGAGSNFSFTMNNCVVRNFLTGAQLFYYLTGATPTVMGALSVSNTEFRNIPQAIMGSGALSQQPHVTTFSNCLFAGPFSSTILINNSSDTGAGFGFTVDHCTFTGAAAKEISIKTQIPVITNTIFTNSTNTTTANVWGTIVDSPSNGVYYTATGVKATLYPRTTNAKSANPMLDANGYATDPEYLTGSTDGKPIGYYSLVPQVPTITTDMLSMPNFNHVSGASEIVPLNVSGTNLTNDIRITVPTGYELSLDANDNFSSTPLVLNQTLGSVLPTDVYVRMANGLARGTYSGNIELTSTNAPTVNVAVTGEMIPEPVISISNLVGFDYSGNGPSDEQYFVVSGSGLTNAILVNAPANYEISTLSGSSFVGSNSINIVPTNGDVTLFLVYVRLKAGLGIGNYNEAISLTSTGVTAQQLMLAGVVSAIPIGMRQKTKSSPVVTPTIINLQGNYSTKNSKVIKLLIP
jgi:hypothetical protein